MSIVSAEELKAYLSGIRLTGSAQQILPTVLDGAQGELEAFLGYPIDTDVPTITETVTVDRDGRLLVSAWPVAEVLSVATGNGTPLVLDAADGYRFTGEGEFVVNGQVYDASGYAITYRPGLPPRPFASAKVKIMRVAGREIAGQHDDSREGDGSPNGRRRPDPPIGWQRGEMRSLSRWRRRTVYSRVNRYLPGVAPDDGTTYGGAGTEVGGVWTANNPMAIVEGDARVTGPGY